MIQQTQCRLIFKHVIGIILWVGCAIFVSCGDEGEGVTPTENEQTPSFSDDQITPPLDGQIPADGIVENQDGKDVVEDQNGEDGGGGDNGGGDPNDEVDEKPVPLPGLPDDVAGYEKWLKLNAKPIPPRPADPHNGTKNVYVNQERVVIAADGEQNFPYPDECIIVKESTRPGKDFIGLIAIMRKKKGNDPAHNDWTWVEYTRNAADGAFREIAKDAVCWGCHSGAINMDYVYTPLE